MHRIVTGAFRDFSGAARAVSTLMDAGFDHGEISIIAVDPRSYPSATPSRSSAASDAALLAGAIGAMAGSGGAWALGAESSALLVGAPVFGAAAGAILGGMAFVIAARIAMVAAQRAPRPVPQARMPDVESVTVVAEEPRAERAEAILREHGARFGSLVP